MSVPFYVYTWMVPLWIPDSSTEWKLPRIEKSYLIEIGHFYVKHDYLNIMMRIFFTLQLNMFMILVTSIAIYFKVDSAILTGIILLHICITV